MGKRRLLIGILLLVVALLLAGCEGYSEMNSSTSGQHGSTGGYMTVKVGKANGTSTKTMETQSSGTATIDALVALTVGTGSYKIELLGENDEVTLVVEAKAGESKIGQGSMVTDGFGEASYRVTAVEAGDVEYTIEYAFR
jgi:hypothetical protein